MKDLIGQLKMEYNALIFMEEVLENVRKIVQCPNLLIRLVDQNQGVVKILRWQILANQILSSLNGKCVIHLLNNSVQSNSFHYIKERVGI